MTSIANFLYRDAFEGVTVIAIYNKEPAEAKWCEFVITPPLPREVRWDIERDGGVF
jgi:hypothetical protein